MNKNFVLLLVTALIFGVATGIYETALPLYLSELGISFAKIGIIFAFASFVIIIARIYIGGLSDRIGRKGLYTVSFILCGLATLSAPFLANLVIQTLLKTVREFGALTRETLFPVILYEEADKGFLGRIGIFRGYEFLMQAVGTGILGLAILFFSNIVTAYQLSLLFAGLLLFIGAAIWNSSFKEQPLRNAEIKDAVPLKEVFSIRSMNSNLILIAVASMLISFGVMFSHSFFMPLFFRDHFGMSESLVTVMLIIHRITIGLPLLFAIFLPYKNYKNWYIIGVAFEGLSLIFGAISKNIWISMPIFMLHDLIGGGIWVPIQATLIQRYSNPNQRGLEVSKVLAFTSIGGILGPLCCGFVADAMTPNMPVIIGGIIICIAIIPLLMLKNDSRMEASYLEEKKTEYAK